jgi:hypothetical protein
MILRKIKKALLYPSRLYGKLSLEDWSREINSKERRFDLHSETRAVISSLFPIIYWYATYISARNGIQDHKSQFTSVSSVQRIFIPQQDCCDH